MRFTLILVAFLSGCLTMSFAYLDDELPKLHGKNIQVAIGYLGIPDKIYEADDQKIYVWTTSETSQVNCRLKVSTKNAVITGSEYSGANGPCFAYSDRLMPLLHQADHG